MDNLSPESAPSPEVTSEPAMPSPVPAAVQMAPGASPMRYAGFWRRFLAMLVDGVILSFASKLLFGNAVTTTETVNGVSSLASNFSGPYALVPVLYGILFWIFLSATPGKMLLGMKVVADDGSKITPIKAILRYVGYFVSGIILGIGFLMIAFDKEKAGLHDKIAGTRVILK